MRYSRFSNKPHGEAGSAVIEFLFFGLALNLAILLGGIQLLDLQRSQYLSQLTAKQVLRAVIRTKDLSVAELTLQTIAKNSQAQPKDFEISLECLPSCSSQNPVPSGAIVSVKVVYKNQVSSYRMKATS